MSHSEHSDPEKFGHDEKVDTPYQLEHTTAQAVGNAKIANVHNGTLSPVHTRTA